MKHLMHRWFSVIVIYIILVSQGCGWKPQQGVPQNVTIPQILYAIEKYSSNIKDLSARVNVRANIDGHSEDAIADIRYINPDRFRIYIKGFAGIDIARISAFDDSMVIYIPNENVYIKAERNENIIGVFIPEFDIDLISIESIVNGTLPQPEERGEFQMSMKRSGKQAELILKRKETMYIYSVKGPNLELVDEKTIHDDVQVWHKIVSKYSSFDGIDFPVEISIERGSNVFQLKFSKCVINSGLTDRDLSFNIPSSAEEAFIEKRR